MWRLYFGCFDGFLVGGSGVDCCCWGGLSGIVTEGDKQGEEEILCNKLEMAVAVLIIGKWVHVKQMMADKLRDRSRDCIDFLLTFIIPSIGEIFLRGATCSTGRLIKERLIVFYLFGLETVFYAFPCLDQVGKQ